VVAATSVAALGRDADVAQELIAELEARGGGGSPDVALELAAALIHELEALVVKLDRLTRSVRDLCDLVDGYFRDGKHALLSVGEQVDTRSAAGRMVLNMLTVIGQWEREAIGERTSAAMQHKASQGSTPAARRPTATGSRPTAWRRRKHRVDRRQHREPREPCCVSFGRIGRSAN
jgi:DNA invertase Pin-like site-specific DNA recombinase